MQSNLVCGRRDAGAPRKGLLLLSKATDEPAVEGETPRTCSPGRNVEADWGRLYRMAWDPLSEASKLVRRPRRGFLRHRFGFQGLRDLFGGVGSGIRRLREDSEASDSIPEAFKAISTPLDWIPKGPV